MLITDTAALPTVAWTRDAQGIFQPSRERYSYVDGTLTSLSPDGKYSFIMRFTTGGNPDYPYYVLYEGQTALYKLSWT